MIKWMVLCALGLAIGCSSKSPATAPTPTPPDNPVAVPTNEPPAKPEPPAEPPKPLATLAGDDKLEEPWRTRFRTWLTAEVNSPYVAVIDLQVMSNAASIVLQRKVEADGQCKVGPSTLTIIQDEGATEPTHEIAHFGEDCCPGTECVRDANGWYLHYLAVVEAKDWKELANLVPAKKKLVYHVVAGGEEGADESTTKLTRKDVAAGKFKDAPSCGFINMTPGCEGLDAKGSGFVCRCDGGGYHVSYTWEKEGKGFVLTSVDEESH